MVPTRDGKRSGAAMSMTPAPLEEWNGIQNRSKLKNACVKYRTMASAGFSWSSSTSPGRRSRRSWGCRNASRRSTAMGTCSPLGPRRSTTSRLGDDSPRPGLINVPERLLPPNAPLYSEPCVWATASRTSRS